MSLPITAVGPLNVLTKPILTDLPWAMAGPAPSASTAPAWQSSPLHVSSPPKLRQWLLGRRHLTGSGTRASKACVAAASLAPCRQPCGEGSPSSPVDLHILEIARLVVDADLGRRDPGRELAALPAGRHQALDEVAVRLGGQPLVLLLRPLGVAQHPAVGRGLDVGELADLAVEGDVRQLEPEVRRRPSRSPCSSARRPWRSRSRSRRAGAC